MVKKRVGIFGGSFDPVHNGHLHIALALKEAAQLDEIIFVPACVSPFKIENPPQASSKERLEMLHLALSPVEGCSLSEEELERGAPSYTVDTLEKLAKDPSLELYLLMAEEAFAHFPKWKDADRIASLAKILVGQLGEVPEEPVPFGAQYFPIPRLEISSTWVRSRLKSKLYCGHLLPEMVLHYIETHELYEK